MLNTLNTDLYFKNRSCLSAHSEPTVDVPPCVKDLGESAEVCSADAMQSMDGTADERLLNSCRQYSQQYRELQKKYHEIIYATAEKVLQTSQEGQMKLLKASLDKVNNEVMHQLREARKVEVKNLALIHKDKDEFIR